MNLPVQLAGRLALQMSQRLIVLSSQCFQSPETAPFAGIRFHGLLQRTPPERSQLDVPDLSFVCSSMLSPNHRSIRGAH